MMEDKQKKYNIEILDRAISITDYLVNKGKASFIDIQKHFGYPKATLHRILFTLENNKYIVKDPITNEYSLGIVFAFYGIKVRSKMTITKICEPIMHELSIKIGETVNLNINYRDNVLNILSSMGEESVLTSKLIPIAPLNCSASGKVFLCLKNDKELLEYFASNKLEKRTINSIVTFDSFLKERENIFKELIAYDKEEYEYGLFCLADFLENDKGYINASISITGPRTRIEMKGIENIKKELKATTEKINLILRRIQYVDNIIAAL